MNLDPITQSKGSQKEKDKYCVSMHIYGVKKDSTNDPISTAAKETEM